LIELLPRRDAVARPGSGQSGSSKKANPRAVAWLIVVALGAAVLFSVLANGAQHADSHGASPALTNGDRSSAQP
jgi:hypothetical protein